MNRTGIWSGLCLLLPLAAITAASAPDPARTLAGRYDREFPDAMMDGTTYVGRDIVEIVPVGPGAAYVRMALDFANGHSCSFAHVAIREGGSLVYRGGDDDATGGKRCTLTIGRTGGALAWHEDAAGTCAYYCGARGTLAQGAVPWRSKRSITYLARLRASSTYRGALSSWRR